jgi:hypothetical protein
MIFWRHNKIDQRFEMPAAEVADRYLAYAESEGVKAEHLAGLPIERSLRYWLTSGDHFDAVWTDETGDESFDTLFNAVLDRIYGKAAKP